jgi:outer membrane protein assembly factor BamE (lipoprotein component of BamABCDE complex)
VARALLAALLLLAGCATAPELNEGDFNRVVIGMSQGDVRRQLGEPAYIEPFARQRQVAWDYPFTDLWSYLATMSILFDADGRVVGKVNVRKDREDN